MGVPALFRWLSKKYPKIISPVIEDQPSNVDGEEVPVDTTKANPNGEEFDNLYLDMNGIVHPCSHPEDRPPPANEEEMMLAVFEYTDRVVNMNVGRVAPCEPPHMFGHPGKGELHRIRIGKECMNANRHM
ncbi:MAG: hypothetical protein Q9178_004000 [Gyalolechia marmorata]